MKTLKNKITLMVTLILILTMGLLTGYSVLNSRQHFVRPILEKNTLYANYAIPAETLPPENTISYDQNTISATVVFDAHKAQREFGMMQVTVMLFIVFCSIILTNYLVSHTLNPLKILNKTTAEIDAHKLSTQIPVPKSQDEIADLTHSFNSMLTRLNRSFALQKEFSQNAAHELKTPLSVIKSSLQILELEDDPTLEDYKENAQIITQSTNDLIEIVGQLLALTDNTDVEKQEIQLKSIIIEYLSTQHIAIEQMNLSIDTHLDSIKLYTNASLIKSVVANLISNAIKYNKQNGSILITLKQQETQAIMCISDTGIGIHKDDLSCIFQPFYRADESRCKKITGHGLGLSIVKSTIEKLGGTIYIDSTLDIGTQITVAFML